MIIIITHYISIFKCLISLQKSRGKAMETGQKRSEYVRENVHQVGSILFETNFIITQLAIRLTSTFRPPSAAVPEDKKAADGVRNVEVSRIASCVIIKFVSNIFCKISLIGG